LPAGGSTPKAADLPAAEHGKEENPSLSLRPSPGPAAAEPGPSPPGRDAGQARVPGGGLDARYEQLRHAALHARAEAFPLGLGVLARGGVTAWRQALASLAPGWRTPGTSTAAPARQPPGMHPAQAAGLPAPVAAELINVLAALALAGAATGPSP
jgi:hypothetical protein